MTQVAIFGAGIAGLTAAHELVERGFDVEVYECEKPSVIDRMIGAPCAIGGMARTQWARVERGQGGNTATGPLELLLDEPEEPGGDVPKLRIYFAKGKTDYVDQAAADATKKEVVDRLKKHLNVKSIEVRGFRQRPATGEAVDLDAKRASKVAAELTKDLQAAGLKVAVAHYPLGIGYAHDWTKADEERDYVSFHVAENWIPGEHGFRFFPSFYRNLFDTMRRTPIADENEPVYQETARTVLDNVAGTSFMALATTLTEKPFPFKRQPSKSLQGLFDQLTGMLAAMGQSLDDMNRFHVKLFKYMTSCRDRRAEYEKLSWYDFLEGDQFSDGFRKYLESGAETLLAMLASNCDARTYGTISVQMIANQLSDLQRTDGTLNAPTSIAWFDHWRRYLQAQGVRFIRGELTGFEVLDSESIWPRVTIHGESGSTPTIVARDYYVLALPAHTLQTLVHKNPALTGKDFDRIRSFNLGDPKKAVTGGALEHMAGIQFYLDTDFKFIEGHTIFPDTGWRLSAIFQPQFWMQKRGWWSGYRGVLSVDISNWHELDYKKDATHTDPKIAWECRKREIADRTRMQITKGIRRVLKLQRRTGIEFPEPLFYHVDDNILFERNGKPSENLTPFLLSRPGEYALRPGTPGNYDVHASKIVLAGTFMQTFTRLTTMEAANESGRHAVNAILKDAHSDAEPVTIYNPEDYEPEDLKLLVEVDDKLHKDGLPHLVDILNLTSVPCSMLSPDCDLSTLEQELGPIIEVPED